MAGLWTGKGGKGIALTGTLGLILRCTGLNSSRCFLLGMWHETRDTASVLQPRPRASHVS